MGVSRGAVYSFVDKWRYLIKWIGWAVLFDGVLFFLLELPVPLWVFYAAMAMLAVANSFLLLWLGLLGSAKLTIERCLVLCPWLFYAIFNDGYIYMRLLHG